MIKLPKFSQWKRVFKILNKKEKVVLLVLFGLAFCCFIFLFSSFYFKYTKIAPASGGLYREGLVGQPQSINPIYGESNDVDRDLIELVFSGLMSYDNNGQIVTDLTDSYKISEDGKTYEFKLKDNIFWHDGNRLTSEDVVFTIKTIQNSDYKSPLRANWLEVESEIISERDFRLKLKSPYNSFLENCTLKIIPKHLWENILPESFALSFYNLRPVGSGPYKFKDLKQTDTGFIKSLTLKANSNYYKEPPHISEISFVFFEKKEDLIKAAEKKGVDGFSSVYLNTNPAPKNFIPYCFLTPRYFALFLNPEKTDFFSNKKIRQALNYSVDKKELVALLNNEFSGKYDVKNFQVVESPILPDFFDYNQSSKNYSFDPEKAKSLLDETGFTLHLSEKGEGIRQKNIEKKPAFQFKNPLALGSKGKDVEELQKCLAKDPEIYNEEITGKFGNATKEAVAKFQKKYDIDIVNFGSVGNKSLKKLNEICMPPVQESQMLQFTITTVNQPILIRAANILKSQWEKIGVSIEVKILNISDLKPMIKERNYETLLYGEALGVLFDLYPFWHSSQKIDPGLNLSIYENKDADKLLKEGRETLDENEKKEKYEKFQDIVLEDAPAVFLYNSGYVYLISNKIKGIETKKITDPSKRFANVEEWYLKTHRVFK